MRCILIALFSAMLAGSAAAADGSYGFIHVDRDGGLSQSASSRASFGSRAVFGSAARERSYGFIHVDRDGGLSQSLHSRSSARPASVSVIGDRAWRNGDRPARQRAYRARGYRALAHRPSEFQARGAFLYVSHSVNPVNRPYIPALDDVAYGGSGTYAPDSGRAAVYSGGYADEGPAPRFPSEPKIIDIATERLDRHPVGPGGIEVFSEGGAKIIRIAPGYSSRRADAGTPREAAVRTVPQPWSEAWMRHCLKAYPSFDPELGTYRDGTGRTRFCTAEE